MIVIPKVSVKHGGAYHVPGVSLDLPDDVAKELIASGAAVETKAPELELEKYPGEDEQKDNLPSGDEQPSGKKKGKKK